jgi:hypothetical protein
MFDNNIQSISKKESYNWYLEIAVFGLQRSDVTLKQTFLFVLTLIK